MFRALTPFTRRSEPARVNDPFAFFQREMNRLFDDAFRAFPVASSEGSTAMEMLAPSIDVKETDKTIEIEAELPGIDEKAVQVSLENDVLTIKGEKKLEKEESKKDYHLCERSYGSFLRAIEMPAGIDPDKVTAKYEKGVLKVSLPKPTNGKAKAKKIEVKAA